MPLTNRFRLHLGSVNWAIILLGFAQWVLIICSYFVRSSAVIMSEALVLLCLAIAIPFTLVVGIFHYGFRSFSWVVPPLLSAMFLSSWLLVGPISSHTDMWSFQHQYDEYDGVVKEVKSGTVPTGSTLKPLDLTKLEHHPWRTDGISAAHCNNGTVVVLFFASTGGRRRTGYLYDDCDDPNIRIVHGESRYQYYPMQGNWYEMSE